MVFKAAPSTTYRSLVMPRFLSSLVSALPVLVWVGAFFFFSLSTTIENPEKEEVLSSHDEPLFSSPEVPKNRPVPTTTWEHSVVQDGPGILSRLWDMIEKTHMTGGSDVELNLVAAVVLVESMGNPRAQNTSGARGLMGIKPVVCKELQKKSCSPLKLLNPTFNLSLGIDYLGYLEDIRGFEGDEVILAYCVGPHKARKLLKIREPQDNQCVRRVLFALEYVS